MELILLAGVILFVMLILIIARPEIATLLVLFLLYTNIPVLIKQNYNLPEFIAASFILLLALPLANYILIKRQKLIIDYPLLLMLLFLVVVILSSFFAKDRTLAFKWILNYMFEGLILYFLIINVIRNQKMLRKAMWVLIFSCTLLGSLSLIQDITRSYHNEYFGLAQRKIELEEGEVLDRSREKVGGKDRAGGPLGESNRYAQIMMTILPFALFFFWGENSLKIRLLAALTGLLILSGIMLSYSRGAFVALVLILILLTFLRYVKVYQTILFLLIFIVMMFIAAPGYVSRIETILGVEGMFSKEASYQPDAVTRGRTTEMLAAFMAFLDYPFLGVGPGHYTPYYSEHYQMDPDIALRVLPKNRRAHTLYFELMAETGILGFCVFMAFILVILYRLWQIGRKEIKQRPKIANLSTALLISILAYFFTAIFLHLAYIRFLWVVLALGGAAIQIYESEYLMADRKKASLKNNNIVVNEVS